MATTAPTIDDRRPLQRIADMDHPTQATIAPGEAFCFAASSPLKFDAIESASDQSVPIELIARTGDPLDHWYWGRIVHDFDGMTHRDRIPLDYRHDSDELVGYLDKFEIRDGDLFLAGSLESVEASDEASRVIARGRRGIPYQSSIFFEEQALEYLPSDMTATVNGREQVGPLIIVRQWELRGCAITPYGYDAGTVAKFSAPDSAPRNLSWSTPVSKTATKPSATTTPADPAAVTPGSATELETPTTPAAPPLPTPASATQLETPNTLDPARAELQRYLGKFGNDGAKYFADGLSYEDALAKAFDSAGERVKQLETELASEKQKLAAAQLEHGERDPIATGPAPATTKGFSSLIKRSGN